MKHSLVSYTQLFKKSLGVSLYKKLSLGFQMPYKYIFITTNICQSKCNSCGIWKIYQDNPKGLKNELTAEQYGKIFDNIKDDAMWVVLSGGEPFIKKDFEDIAILAAKKLNKLFIINIPTNGLAPDIIVNKTKNILNNIDPKINLFITVSLDGIGHVYEKVRGVDSYDKVIETYERLSEMKKEHDNLNVGFQTTVSKLNLDHVKEIFDRVKDTDTPIFTFANEADYFYNEGSQVDVKKLDKEELMKVIDFLSKNYKVKGLLDVIPKVYLKIAKKFYENPNKQVLPCTSSWATLTFDPYGNVVPCSYFFRIMGNVKESNFDIKSIMKSEKVKETREIIKTHQCPKCWTNCEAYPTMFHNPISTLKKFMF